MFVAVGLLQSRYFQMTGSIVVINNSFTPCHVFVSKYTNKSASDDWYTIPVAQRESWQRNGWELVAFKNDADTERAGKYVRVDSTVTFTSLGNIEVS